MKLRPKRSKGAWRQTRILPLSILQDSFLTILITWVIIDALDDVDKSEEERLVLREALAAEREAGDAMQNGLVNDIDLHDLAQRYLEEEGPLETEEIIELLKT